AREAVRTRSAGRSGRPSGRSKRLSVEQARRLIAGEMVQPELTRGAFSRAACLCLATLGLTGCGSGGSPTSTPPPGGRWAQAAATVGQQGSQATAPTSATATSATGASATDVGGKGAGMRSLPLPPGEPSGGGQEVTGKVGRPDRLPAAASS